ncbi:MAG TPA: hypothetical protein VFW05_17865 [Verrucomicrobiae bacterium]|jgi:hypothetical protein|nr:hypothetical protein [Verrucomicrobiae bacterium]
MHFLLHEPILAGTVLLCLAIVGGLVLSDWNAKRRARNLLKMRDGLREQYRQQTSGTPASTVAATAKPAFRIFRWEFAVLCAIVVFFLLPKSQESVPVEAKSSSNSTNDVAPPDQSPVVEVESSDHTPVKVAASGKSAVTDGTASVSVDALFEHEEDSSLSIQSSQSGLRKDIGSSFAPNDFDRPGFPGR